MNVVLRPEHLNILSICTGGAGLDLGVELAIPSARTVCMVEREAFAVASLVAAMEQGLLHPAPVWSDARTFDGRAWRGAVDGLIGGIPCQPHSLAGRKQGSNDDRDLWSTARRIIVQSGAWFVVIENVGGMLAAGSDEIAGAQRVFRDLHKLGFETEGGLFTAAEVGASHQRERIFILAVADPRRRQLRRWTRSGSFFQEARGSEGQGDQRERDGDAIGGSSRSVSGVGLADAYSQRLEGVGSYSGAQRWADEGRSAGLCDGAVLVHPECAERRPHVVSGHEPDRDHQRWDKAAGRAGEPSQLVDDDASIARGRPVSIQPRRQGQTRSDVDRSSAGHGSISRFQHMADANCNEPPQVGRDAGEVPNTSEGEGGAEHGSAISRGFGLPHFPPGPAERDAWGEILSRSPELEPAFRRMADGVASPLDIGRVDRLRMLGNGVVPLQAAHAIRSLALTLARRGSASAIELVRMMEGVDA